MVSYFILILIFRGIGITAVESVRRHSDSQGPSSLWTLNVFVSFFILLKKYVGKCPYTIEDSEIMAFLASWGFAPQWFWLFTTQQVMHCARVQLLLFCLKEKEISESQRLRYV